MSEKITKTIEILKAISDKYPTHCDFMSYKKLRKDADKLLTDQLKLAKGTVSNKFRRELKGINNTSHFDELCFRWLQKNDTELRKVLLNNWIDDDDRVKIIAFFDDYQNMDLNDDGRQNPISDNKEGKEKYITHKAKERNRKVVKEAKTKWLEQQNGVIKCSICEFDFHEKYGDRGLGFIEAHHTVPISTLKSECVVTIDDLVPLCANCHRMIHLRPWLSIEEMKSQIRTIIK